MDLPQEHYLQNTGRSSTSIVTVFVVPCITLAADLPLHRIIHVSESR